MLVGCRDDGGAGTGSIARDFRLDTLGHDRFYLNQNKGKVVVLYDTKSKGTTKGRPKARTVGLPKTEEEKEIDELKMEEKKYRAGGLEQRAIEEEVEKKKKIEDIKAMAGKFKPNSLEYKAMMEEIEKINKQ